MNPNFYMHRTDRAALDALKAVPGFSQLFKAFMKVWDEKIFHIKNMSSNLRINEKQLPKYYRMLLPICKKLGIEVPELYLTLNVVPNAYTVGDTKPCIVMTSGLLETLPEELIPSVLAHECGHIACHHCLYTTIGHFLLNDAKLLLTLIGVDGITMAPIQMAFYYWMRCSELSADRAAAICDGTSDKVVETCMRFAGLDKDILLQANAEEFMSQAVEYREMIKDDKWNKAIEFYMYNNRTHPLNAVRAYECAEWAKDERFRKIVDYVNNDMSDDFLETYFDELPMSESSKFYIGKNQDEVQNLIREIGFKNVETRKNTQKNPMVREGQVIHIRINGKEGFDACDWYPIDANIDIEYYGIQTREEEQLAHQGQLKIPNVCKYYIGKIYTDVIQEFQEAGFQNVTLEEVRKEKKNLFNKNGAVSSVSINGQTQFSKGEWFDEKANILITYYTFTE